MEKQEIEVSFDKCQSCAYLNPKQNHCQKYLRGAETAVYLCPFCKTSKEMEEVSRLDSVYQEYLND